MFYVCSMSGVHLVWFKRDLRVHDHAPLLAAVASGAPVIPLYIFEPGYWTEPELSRRQFDFLMDSLRELDAALQARGSRLMVRTGEATEVFSALHREYGLDAIHAHEEVGLQWALGRDRAVYRWARNAGVSMREQPSLPPGREPWSVRWDRRMAEARGKAPEQIRSPTLMAPDWPLPEDFGLGANDCPARQPGGRSAGVECLRAFLEARGPSYAEGLAHPKAGAELSSRLSAHFAFGTLSLREAWQAARRALGLAAGQGDAVFAASMEAFLANLKLHGQFVQMLQAQTTLDSRNLQPAHDGLRPRAEPSDPRLEAWIEGRTGFPFLDACMRSLKATGWLNFQTRAMVMGFVSHHLWLDWRLPAERIAARFTDFDPAIHYAQARIQAAATGVDTPRIFNPVKQSREQDPDGAFIREWVPELARLPDAFLHAPWDAPPEFLSAAGVVLGQTYPMRIVDHLAAANEARARIAAVRRSHAPAAAADDFKARLAGRARRAAPRRNPPKTVVHQLDLDFGLTQAS
jgi:deoxyribodipyrimidine photo-lyase